MDANHTPATPPASDRNTITEQPPFFDDAALLEIAKIRTERRQKRARPSKFWQGLAQRFVSCFRG
ncbi:hypothetical protein BY454_12718 [Marinobacter persicus]|uniref:Uncharacterized protein n=1 Tax=Marinobacter persicus TaxID=930118 RepID=A0A2S6G466_9GAMM|nr:hypothetical protein BY455_12532 [Marinobacter persicus]PPK53754.1 hypothetical protein B0H24_102532 [Marinobacter persicus]PPK56975.1 hypothetical protein BY454_12718 [Marinobacter persicus]